STPPPGTSPRRHHPSRRRSRSSFRSLGGSPPMRSSLPLLAIALVAAPAAAAPIDFARDVRPILSQHCFKCHGPDDKARKAGLRLDLRSVATAMGKSGETPIVPSRPDESELVRRIYADDETDVMPPPATKKPLNDAQRATLKKWIAEGAEYKDHWAFIPPKQAPFPAIKQAGWARNSIDDFVLARLEAAGLNPSPPADKYTLVRRLYLDLIGLPPTPAAVDAFVSDRSPDAYERLLDPLLASPPYREPRAPPCGARGGPPMARPGPVRGHERLRKGPPADHVALPRLGHPRLE